MKATEKKNAKPRYNLWVRITALAMSILVTGGVLTYIVMFIMNLFEHSH